MMVNKKLIKFAEQMQQELDANLHKGDWETFTNLEDIFSELDWHRKKLENAIKDSDKDRILEYSADCANILLFIANACDTLDNIENNN